MLCRMSAPRAGRFRKRPFGRPHSLFRSPERWRPLAERKLAEIDARIARAAGMKALLEASLACGCVTLDACELVRRAATPEPLQPPAR